MNSCLIRKQFWRQSHRLSVQKSLLVQNMQLTGYRGYGRLSACDNPAWEAIVMRTRSLLGYSLGAFALVAAAAAFPSAGHAIDFLLTSDHCTGGCIPAGGNAGTVTKTQNGANVDITVALAAGFSFVKTGSADFQNFKFNGVGVALGASPSMRMCRLWSQQPEPSTGMAQGISCSGSIAPAARTGELALSPPPSASTLRMRRLLI
jgi:hypothetical protein